MGNEPSETMQIVAAVIGMITTLFTAYMAYLVHKLNIQAKQAATEAKVVKETLLATNEEVKTALQEGDARVNAKLDNAAQIADATQSLVTSSMTSQLQLHALTARRLASMTRNPDDVRAAELAEKIFQEHLDKSQGTTETKGES